jgi:hypothetical protein
LEAYDGKRGGKPEEKTAFDQASGVASIYNMVVRPKYAKVLCQTREQREEGGPHSDRRRGEK